METSRAPPTARPCARRWDLINPQPAPTTLSGPPRFPLSFGECEPQDAICSGLGGRAASPLRFFPQESRPLPLLPKQSSASLGWCPAPPPPTRGKTGQGLESSWKSECAAHSSHRSDEGVLPLACPTPLPSRTPSQIKDSPARSLIAAGSLDRSRAGVHPTAPPPSVTCVHPWGKRGAGDTARLPRRKCQIGGMTQTPGLASHPTLAAVCWWDLRPQVPETQFSDLLNGENNCKLINIRSQAPCRMICLQVLWHRCSELMGQGETLSLFPFHK